MKVVIRNRTASLAKYGNDGLAALDVALMHLKEADDKRGIVTRIIDVDDVAAMSAIPAPPVKLRQSASQLKAAIDAIDKALNPDFFLLLDGPDVLPHVDLKMPKGLDADPDRSIPSDLPYACSQPYIQDPARYGAVTRVVGRLPAPPAHHDPIAFLLRHLKRLANHHPAKSTEFDTPFALSAQIWDTSTQLSVENAFGVGKTVLDSPSAGPNFPSGALSALPHFINCHGAESDVQFYGQDAVGMPVALTSAGLVNQIRPGTVVAAECCYGAQLFDPDLSQGQLPIALRYLDEGAIGFVGATNIAYGPADQNGQADLMAQFFMAKVRQGLTLGRALLEARQEFVRTQSLANPLNVKTLAQFVLYGDPSVQACEPLVKTAEPELAMPTLGGLLIKSRVDLKASGLAAAGQALYVTGHELDGEISERFGTSLAKIAARHGFEDASSRILEVRGGPLLGRLLKQRNESRASVVYSKKVSVPSGADRVRVLSVSVENDRLVKIELSESR